MTDQLSKLQGYWTALGQFIDEFSKIEALMQVTLSMESGVDRTMARAVFSGVRIDQAKDLINRVRETKGLEEDATLRRAFGQLTIINQKRNDIVHYGAHADNEGNFQVSNAAAAHIPARERSFPISPEILLDMTYDLNTIKMRLLSYILEIGQRTPGAIIQGDTGPVLANFRRAAGAPWRYTPPPPLQPSKQPPKNPPVRTNRPDASTD